MPESKITQDEKAGTSRLIRVNTDVLEVGIDPVGGTVVSVRLLDYPVKHENPDVKVELLRPNGANLFIAQSGLLSKQDAPNHTSEYRTTAYEYTLSEGDSELLVPLTWTSEDGIEVSKKLCFQTGKLRSRCSAPRQNKGSADLVGNRYEQLQTAVPGDEEDAGFTNPGRYSFFGIGFYNPEDKFEKIDFDDVADEPYTRNQQKGWLAMIQHYFFAAWIPPAKKINLFNPGHAERRLAAVYRAQRVAGTAASRRVQRHAFTSNLYLGPKLQDDLPGIAARP